jgi:LuxR family maltose regulon positive regulatory protein
MDNVGFVKTKIVVPQLISSLIERPALIGRISKGEDKKVTTIVAPAGYGKSTLLTMWAKQLDDNVAWLSLDKFDNDPDLFIRYLLTSIAVVWPDFGQELFSQIRSPAPLDHRTILVEMINEILERDSRLYLVLDDFQYISDEQVLDLVCYLVDYLPHEMHMVIASREAVPICKPRMRFSGELNEIDQSDLIFESEEAHRYLLQSFGEEINQNKLPAIMAKTEGWITGLKLITLLADETEGLYAVLDRLSGSNRFIDEYFFEEVFQKQQTDIQVFLMRTGLLDKFSAALCDDILDQENSRSILSGLESSGLFLIPLDIKREWFRYHHLFSDFLSSQDQSQEEKFRIHRKAAEWYAANDLDEDAIKNFLAIGDYENTLKIIEKNVIRYWGKGRFQPLKNWIKHIPMGMLDKYPVVVMAKAWLTFLDGEYKKAFEIIEGLDICAAEESTPDEEYRRLIGRYLTIKSHLSVVRYDPSLTLSLAQEVIPYRSVLDPFWLAYHYLTLSWVYENSGDVEQAISCRRKAFDVSKDSSNGIIPGSISALFFSIYLYSLGRFDECQNLCEEGLSYYQQVRFLKNYHGIHHILMGSIAFHRRLYEEAEIRLELGIQLIERDSDEIWLIDSLYLLSLVKLERKNCTEAQTIRQRMSNIFHKSEIQELIIGHYQVVDRSLQLILDQAVDWKPDENKNYVENYSSSRYQNRLAGPHRNQFYCNDTPFLFSFEFERITFIKALLVKGELHQAKEWVLKWGGDFQNSLRSYEKARFFSLSGKVFFKLGLQEQAANYLMEFIHVTKKGDFIQLIHETKPLLNEIFLENQAIENKDNRNLNWMMINEFLEEYHIGQKLEEQHCKKESVLTPREQEIALLASKGMQNSEIAVALVISENTVRTHIKNINKKVEAKNRAHMIAQCLRLDLI